MGGDQRPNGSDRYSRKRLSGVCGCFISGKHDRQAQVLFRKLRRSAERSGNCVGNQFGLWYCRKASHRFPAGVAQGPGPLEIVAAEPARHVDRFADKMESRHDAFSHRLRGDLARVVDHVTSAVA